MALARAMVKKPKVFLMDEPCPTWTPNCAARCGWSSSSCTTTSKPPLYVTHDQVEAMSMADRIILLNNGVIQQEANPREIYINPCNKFTAQFIGAPQMNILPLPGSDMSFGFRPEKVTLTEQAPDAFLKKKARIITREMLGSETLYQLRFDKQSIMVKSLSDVFLPGTDVYFSLRKEDILLFKKDENRLYPQEDGYVAGLAQGEGVSIGCRKTGQEGASLCPRSARHPVFADFHHMPVAGHGVYELYRLEAGAAPAKNFVGLHNYRYLFGRSISGTPMGNTFYYSVLTVISQFCAATLFAVWLRKNTGSTPWCAPPCSLPTSWRCCPWPWCGAG